MATNMVFMAVMVLLAAGAANVEAKTYKSIAQFLMKDKQSSLLLAAATAAGLVDTFKDTSLEVTVFAPSNRAINAALKELNITVEDLVADVDNLKNILLYHAYGDAAVRAGKVPSGSTVLTMLNGANLTVEKTTMMHKPMVTLLDSMMREVKVVRTNIKAGKSIIHIIDNVLLPPAAPAPEEPSPSPAADPSPSPAADPSPSPAADPSPAPEPSPSPAAVPDLFAALKAENLNTLPVVAGALFPMEVLTGLSNVTILAPTDAAFNELLAAAQGLGLEVDLANLTDTVKAVLTGILSTHIIPGQYKAADLTDGAVVTSLNEVEVAVDLKTPGSVIFNVVSVPSSTATVVKADIMADKGIVIHIIDKVLSNIDLSSLGK